MSKPTIETSDVKGYLYFYINKDGKKDKERGLYRVTKFSFYSGFSTYKAEELIKANWFEQMMFWKDLDFLVQVKYSEYVVVGFINTSRIDRFDEKFKYTSKVRFELLLKQQDPETKYYQFKGYSWKELKDVPLHKRFGYMYHFDSEKKSSFILDVFKILIGAAVGAVITYFIKY